MAIFIQAVVLIVVITGLIYAVYKGFNQIMACVIAGIVIAFAANLNVYEVITGDFMNSYGSLMSMMALKILCSVTLGQIYIQGGGANAVADLFEKLIIRNSKGLVRKKITAYTYFGLCCLLCLGGFDAFAALFTMLPIGLVFWERGDLPKNILPGVMFAAVTLIGCYPATVQVNNLMAPVFFGSEQYGAAIPAVVGASVMLVLDVLMINSLINKADKRGVSFERGRAQMADFNNRKTPNGILSLAPILLVFVLYTVLGWPQEVSMLCGIILALILFVPYMRDENDKISMSTIKQISENSASGAILGISMSGIQMGLAAVVSATALFDKICEWFLMIPGSGYIGFAIAVTLLGFLAGSSTSGMMFGATVYGPVAQSLGMTANAMARIGVFGVAILDTIPICGPIIMSLNVCGLSQKEGYGTIFKTTVLYVAIGIVVCTALYILFPGLA